MGRVGIHVQPSLAHPKVGIQIFPTSKPAQTGEFHLALLLNQYGAAILQGQQGGTVIRRNHLVPNGQSHARLEEQGLCFTLQNELHLAVNRFHPCFGMLFPHHIQGNGNPRAGADGGGILDIVSFQDILPIAPVLEHAMTEIPYRVTGLDGVQPVVSPCRHSGQQEKNACQQHLGKAEERLHWVLPDSDLNGEYKTGHTNNMTPFKKYPISPQWPNMRKQRPHDGRSREICAYPAIMPAFVPFPTQRKPWQ